MKPSLASFDSNNCLIQNRRTHFIATFEEIYTEEKHDGHPTQAWSLEER